jgi:hypothetical protein
VPEARIDPCLHDNKVLAVILAAKEKVDVQARGVLAVPFIAPFFLGKNTCKLDKDTCKYGKDTSK